MPAVRIPLEGLLHHKRQAIKALAHVRVTGRQPNPRATWNRNHRRRRLLGANAAMSAFMVDVSTGPVIRIRPPAANSISITPARAGAAAQAIPASGAIATG